MIQEDFSLFAKRFKEALFLLQDDGTILSCNAAAQNLFNMSEIDLIDKKLIDYLSDPLDKINRYLLLWKSSGEYLPGGFSLSNENAKHINITIEGCLLKPRTHKGPALLLLRCFPKSKSIKSFSVLTEKIQQLTKEIHDRTAVEKGLRESEEKVRLLLQSTAEAIYGVNNKGLCTFANKALLDMLKIDSESQLIGKNIHSLIHHTNISGKNISENKSPIYQAYNGKQEVYVEEDYIWTPEGKYILVEYWAHPILQEGSTQGAVVTIIDITERRQINDALRTLAISTSSSIGNRFFEDSVKTLANIFRAKIAFIGLLVPENNHDVDTVAFWEDGDFQPSMRIPLSNTPCCDIVTGKYIYVRDNLKAEYPDAKIMHDMGIESYYGIPLMSSEGTTMGLVSILHTQALFINERTEALLHIFAKRIAMELEQRQTTKALHEYQDHLETLVFQRTKELEHAYRDLESYSYSIAHDLRAPLRSITSFSEILRDDLKGKLDTTEEDFLNRIINSSKFMAELISDILELSRITRSEISHKEIDLSRLVKDIIQEKIQQNPNTKFNINIQDGIFTSGDLKLFYLLLDNLIENAIKFSKHKSETYIEFKCKPNNDNRLICHIKDNGAGFNSDYKEKLFVPFQRLHGRDEFEGTGIGLATVKRILERHQGEVWVDAEVEKGACFYFTCPDFTLKKASTVTS